MINKAEELRLQMVAVVEERDYLNDVIRDKTIALDAVNKSIESIKSGIDGTMNAYSAKHSNPDHI